MLWHSTTTMKDPHQNPGTVIFRSATEPITDRIANHRQTKAGPFTLVPLYIFYNEPVKELGHPSTYNSSSTKALLSCRLPFCWVKIKKKSKPKKPV